MKDVFVSHSKEDKSIAKKLVSKLESSGVGCYIYSRDKNSGSEKELISNSSIFILILSEYAQQSQDLIRQLKIAVENNCNIIPFKAGKTDTGLSTQYLLHTLEWVDAFEDGFDEAYDILLEILEEINEGKPFRSTSKKKSSDAGEGFKLQKPHLIGIIAVLAVIVIYFVFFNDKTETTNNNNTITNNIDPPDYVDSDLKDEEKVVVGSWKMVDYEDSRTMTAEEQAVTEQNISDMKRKVLLTFNADRSFSRAGFTQQVQEGYWEYNNIKKKIYLTPANVNKREEINILNINNKEMTFVVTEVIQNPQGSKETVTTKITFQKQ